MAEQFSDRCGGVRDHAAAERSLELVRRTWYPDVTLGLSVYDEDGADSRPFGGYEAMISLAIPLQWEAVRGARARREGEARGLLSQARIDGSMRGQIEESWWALDGLRHGVDILRRSISHRPA